MNEDQMLQDDDSIFEESQEDKTSEEETPENEPDKSKEEKDTEEDEDEGKTKSRRSEIAQKKHWREKYQKTSTKVQELEEELEKLKGAVKKPEDDKERAAQEYIRKQAREVFEDLQKERQKAESNNLDQFETELDSVLEDNPDVTEEEILDIIEEMDVSPTVAMKIFKRESSKQEKTKKPKMPTPKRGSSSQDKDRKPNDSNKSMWEIAREEIAKSKE